MNKKNELVARLDNQLVMRAHYNLSSNEQKLVLFLVSKIDSSREDFNIQRVKVKDIGHFFVNDDKKRWGSIYERVDMMCNNITDKKITLPKGFVIDGNPIRMHRYVQWFSDIEPYLDDQNEICLKFQFTEALKDYLLQLKEYVRINVLEVLPMRGKHAIRMFQIFKAERDRTQKHKEVSQLIYGVDELKGMLGIGMKYKAYQDFKKRVLNPIKEEINLQSKEISIDYIPIKTRRKVTDIEFSIYSKTSKTGQNVDYVPTEKDLAVLTWGKRLAYQELIKFGVKEGIAFKRILPNIGGSEIEGFEDMFIKYSIQYFKKWSKNQNNKKASAGTFVNWWHKKKVFNNNVAGNVWGEIAEKLIAAKNKMDRKAYDNRVVAKKMTESEFKAWYKKQQQSDAD